MNRFYHYKGMIVFLFRNFYKNWDFDRLYLPESDSFIDEFDTDNLRMIGDDQQETLFEQYYWVRGWLVPSTEK